MPSWLKKAFGKKDERETPPPPATRPSTSGAQSSQRQTQARPSTQQRSSTPSSSSRIYSGVVNTGGAPPLPRPQGRNRISTHDLTMAAVTLGVAPPPSPPSGSYSPAASSSSTPATGSLRPDLQQQQIDSDLAMAYSLAQQEQQQTGSSSGQQRLQPPPPPLQQPQRPLPPLPQQNNRPGLPVTSPFGDAVSLPPPAAGTRPDLAMAAALAESQFSARQADELARTTEAVYQAAVNKALEASLQTANYDDLLRDIKIWIIDLAASTDDVLAALDSIVKERQDVAVRLEKALDADDERKIRKLGWMAEQLPAVEEKLRNLADKMMPIGVAVVELQDLRDHVSAALPPLEEAGRQRDLIISRLLKAMKNAGLRPPYRSSEYSYDDNGAGPSTSAAAAAAGPLLSRPATPELQAPADLRDLVASLISEAQKLPKMPRKKSSGSIATSTVTETTSLADLNEAKDTPTTPGRVDAATAGGGDGDPLLSGNGTTPESKLISEEIIEHQPSAPVQEQQQEQEIPSASALETPIEADLISFENLIEDELSVVSTGALSATAAASKELKVGDNVPLQAYPLEIVAEEEEKEEEKQKPQQQQLVTSETTPLPSENQSEQIEDTITTPAVATTVATKENKNNSSSNGNDAAETTKVVSSNNKKAPLWRRLSNRSPTSTPGSVNSTASSIPSATSIPSSSRRTTTSPSGSTFTTTPVPFQLSTSRWKAKGPSEAPAAADTLRRVPALISLHYEMEKDSGVVADAVGWAANTATTKIEVGPSVEVAPPVDLSTGGASFGTPEEMVAFVKAQPNGSFPTIVPSRFDASSRWSVMCAAAGAHDALISAVDELSTWEVKTPGGGAGAASVVAETHRLVDYLAGVSAILSSVSHTHDPLRHALVKHRLPWEENLTTQVRWAAQQAGIAVMSQAIEVSEEAERTKGPWQRQAVLKPLGHGVMAAFSVHQLAGGFGTEGAAVCDYLVERTVHYARMIDPKWFRGHKVVAS